MKNILFILLAFLLVMCSSPQVEIRDDFKSVSEKKKVSFLKSKNGLSSSKSILLLTNGYKGENIVAKQNNITVYNAYPISNLKNNFADSFSFDNTSALVINDLFSKKQIIIKTQHSKKYKFIYLRKIYKNGKITFKISLSNSLYPFF